MNIKYQTVREKAKMYYLYILKITGYGCTESKCKERVNAEQSEWSKSFPYQNTDLSIKKNFDYKLLLVNSNFSTILLILSTTPIINKSLKV